MRRILFVPLLFVMAAACVVIAVADRSWGWFFGGGVFLSVAIYARRLLNQERETGPAAPRLGFVAVAMLAMVLAIFMMYLLDSST